MKMGNIQHDMLANLPSVRAIDDDAGRKIVLECARSEAHNHMMPPTHAGFARRKCVSCAALGNVALAQGWFSHSLAPMETAQILNMYQNELQRRGFAVMVIPAPKGEKFGTALVKHFGFTDLGEINLYGKAL